MQELRGGDKAQWSFYSYCKKTNKTSKKALLWEDGQSHHCLLNSIPFKEDHLGQS